MKLQSNELRLGNLLYPIHLDGYAKVIEIMVSGVGIQKMDDETQKSLVLTEYIHRLEPIPLTEEWLVKFGFNRCINNKDSGCKQYGRNRKGIDLI
jgi:hypothetical protein